MISYLIDSQGGFTVGDRQTTRTAYAYPTSRNARMAKADAARTAAAMLAHQPAESELTRDYDRRNWEALFFNGHAVHLP